VTTRISDIVVPEVFSPYVQVVTEEKTLIIQSGAAVRDPALDEKLAGGGLTFNVPAFKDLGNEDANISDDDPTNKSSPLKIGSATEIGVRLSRNKSWSSMDLTAALAGADPMAAIGGRVGEYWSRESQRTFVAVMKGVFADNDAAPSGTEHVAGDLTYDIKGASYSAGVTDFSAPAFIDAAVTMGDSEQDLGLVLMHSLVYARAQKNNLIDFIPDAEGRTNIPVFLGRRVVRDDGMPNSAGVFETWLFGAGAVRIGYGNPEVPTELMRDPDAGNGSGQETLFNRVEWCFHPTGHKFAVASPANGGPSNASTTGNLAHLASWQRVYPERKQIKIARLITREY
jgi:hypothetical protein